MEQMPALILNNRYQVEAQIGLGGMATVYRAQDLMLERKVAVKVLRKEYSEDPELRERFRQEAKAAANLSHPNIVTVHDFGLDAARQQLFIVMEYVPGTDLKHILKQRGRLSIEEAVDLVAQACAGIGYAHRAGLVHCDVKPQNMLVTPEKRLKVVDFGIARALATIVPEERSEIVWGSPNYFSPEQAAGGAPSPASDVYSLGVVLYELLTGYLPFRANTAQELARMHRETLPPMLRQLNPSIPEPLEQIVLKVLAKEPARRYRTADQLGRVLVSFGQTPPTTPLPTGTSSAAQPPSAGQQMTAPQRTFSPDTGSQPHVVSPAPASAGTRPVTPRPSASQPVVRPSSGTIPVKPASRPAQRSSQDFDWLTWLFVLLALIAAGGLVPFWFWVYYMLNPPL